MPAQLYILFDGSCPFCNRAAMWVARRDTEKRFLLVSGLASRGQDLLRQHGLEGVADRSIVLIRAQRHWVKSEALKKILIRLPRWRKAALLIGLLPSAWSDWLYDRVAAVRKRLLMGTSCPVPEEALRDRFIV